MPFAQYGQNGFLRLDSVSRFQFSLKDKRVEVELIPLDQKINQLLVSVFISLKESENERQSNNVPISQNQERLINKNSDNKDRKQTKQCISNEKTVKYSQVFDIWDFVNFSKQRKNANQSESLLWFKLYLEVYFTRLSHLPNILSQKHSENSHYESTSDVFNFTDQIYIKKIYKNNKKVKNILEEVKMENPNVMQTLSEDNQNNKKQQEDQNISEKKALLLKINPKYVSYQNDYFHEPFLINIPRKLIDTQNVISAIQITEKLKDQKEKEIQKLFFDNKIL